MVDLTQYKSLSQEDYEQLSTELENERKKYIEIILRLENNLTTQISANKLLFNEYKRCRINNEENNR